MKKEIEEQGEGFSSVDLICQCLIDEDKAKAFDLVLKHNIKPTSKVLDIGTGSGILALMAANAGSKDITAIEFDPYIAEIARQNIKMNNLNSVINVITADARNLSFSNKKTFDVVVMEMLATGLVDEMQVETINNLVDKKLINDSTVIIPAKQENYLQLANSNFEIYGFNMKMTRHLWPYDNKKSMICSLSDISLLSSIDFSHKNNLNFNKVLEFTVNKSGLLNSVFLTSKIFVSSAENITLGNTHSLNPIVIVPLEDRQVNSGEIIKISIEYTFGNGYKGLLVNYVN